MRFMNAPSAAGGLFLLSAAAMGVFCTAAGALAASSGGQCAAVHGYHLSGTVTTAPVFAAGHRRGGVELSHTRLHIRADEDEKTYEVAIDNVFASGYDAAQSRRMVPAPLDLIHVGDRLDLCGKRYNDGTGIDWVHTNCGAKPSRNKPDGWVRRLNADGDGGANLESSTAYCGLW